MKNDFWGLISGLVMFGERIPEPENTAIEISKTEKAKRKMIKKEKKNRTSMDYVTTTRSITCIMGSGGKETERYQSNIWSNNDCEFPQIIISHQTADPESSGTPSMINATKQNKTKPPMGHLKDGGRVRRGDYLPPHKYIWNTSTCGTTPTEYLLNAGRRPQTSQKAINSTHKRVGQKKNEKTETKE